VRRDLDLNEQTISQDGGPRRYLEDVSYPNERVACYFRRIKTHLLRHIGKADYVFGCVAWFTDLDIVEALSRKRGVCILVQKEDFLRPDVPSAYRNPAWKRRLRTAYESVRGVQRHRFHGCGVAGSLSYGDIEPMAAIRCVGVSQNKWMPRMHHKFALFANEASREHSECWTWELPSEVWTGSYNWSQTANRSLENAVVVSEEKTVKGFYLEFQQVLGLSEPCDWTSEWVCPEYRFGT
jgi:hypothetical protein